MVVSTDGIVIYLLYSHGSNRNSEICVWNRLSISYISTSALSVNNCLAKCTGIVALTLMKNEELLFSCGICGRYSSDLS